MVSAVCFSTTDSLEKWLHHVIGIRGEKHLIPWRTIIQFYTEQSMPLLVKALNIAELLLSLGLDNETLSTVLLYPAYQENKQHHKKIASLLSEGGKKLLHDILHIQSLEQWHQSLHRSHQQTENMRKMLLAMVSDVRAVLVILAERLWHLHQLRHATVAEQQHLAQESLDIYAPLASRLGIWQLKSKIEDLCLLYLQPEVYENIQCQLSTYRVEYEQYIRDIIDNLNNRLKAACIRPFQVTGRIKHIYSIYHKMLRKNLSFDQIHDIVAIRVLTDNIANCYTVLSLIQNTWPQWSDEFDDYIMHPKPNGYRSIHTVIVGPNQHAVEIQIRTQQMHQESELGVAAHWRYKEGILQAAHYEAKIALLRQIMAWQQDVFSSRYRPEKHTMQHLFADRIYVFTPHNDIIDLPNGATPIDFAYYVHSNIGHCCRGAKVNKQMVPLTYRLKTGDCVEILTSNKAAPSRDWLNKNLNYLATKRARIRVRQWFRVKEKIK